MIDGYYNVVSMSGTDSFRLFRIYSLSFNLLHIMYLPNLKILDRTVMHPHVAESSPIRNKFHRSEVIACLLTVSQGKRRGTA